MQPQQRKHIGASPPCGEDTPDQRQVQTKENEGGASAKGSVLRLTCVPLPHLVFVAAFLPGVARSHHFVDMWVAEGHTARLLWLCVCVCWSPIAGGVGVGRRRACPHRRGAGPWCTACVNGAATSWAQWLCEVVCVAIAVFGPTLVTPENRGGSG